MQCAGTRKHYTDGNPAQHIQRLSAAGETDVDCARELGPIAIFGEAAEHRLILGPFGSQPRRIDVGAHAAAFSWLTNCSNR